MTVLEKLEAMQDFTYAEQKIATYILKNKDEIGDMTISELAAFTYTSNAAIVRMCRKMEMKGYKEFRVQLVRDIERRQREQSPIDMDRPFYKKDSAPDIVRQIWDLMTETVRTCYETIPAKELEKVTDWILTADTVYLYAMGDSLVNAIGFANRLIKLKKQAVIINQYGETGTHIRNAGEKDVMLVITYSGHNLLDHKFLVSLKRKRCRLVAISSQADIKGYDAVIQFPARESYDEKIATYYSQTSIQYILNCIYGIAFAKSGD